MLQVQFRLCEVGLGKMMFRRDRASEQHAHF